MYLAKKRQVPAAPWTRERSKPELHPGPAPYPFSLQRRQPQPSAEKLAGKWLLYADRRGLATETRQSDLLPLLQALITVFRALFVFQGFQQKIRKPVQNLRGLEGNGEREAHHQTQQGPDYSREVRAKGFLYDYRRERIVGCRHSQQTGL